MTPERKMIETCACHRIRMAARTVTRAYDDALRPVGLRATQLSVLAAVAVEGAMSITAIAQLMGIGQPRSPHPDCRARDARRVESNALKVIAPSFATCRVYARLNPRCMPRTSTSSRGKAFCFMSGPDEEAIRKAHAAIDLPFDSITEVRRVTGADMRLPTDEGK